MRANKSKAVRDYKAPRSLSGRPSIHYTELTLKPRLLTESGLFALRLLMLIALPLLSSSSWSRVEFFIYSNGHHLPLLQPMRIRQQSHSETLASLSLCRRITGSEPKNLVLLKACIA